jgi:hypothetical protein
MTEQIQILPRTAYIHRDLYYGDRIVCDIDTFILACEVMVLDTLVESMGGDELTNFEQYRYVQLWAHPYVQEVVLVLGMCGGQVLIGHHATNRVVNW